MFHKRFFQQQRQLLHYLLLQYFVMEMKLRIGFVNLEIFVITKKGKHLCLFWEMLQQN